MAQALEKIFLQKVAQMPQEEVELLPPAPKGKGRKPSAGVQSAGTGSQGGQGAGPLCSGPPMDGLGRESLSHLSCFPSVVKSSWVLGLG